MNTSTKIIAAAVASLFIAAPTMAHVGYGNALFLQAGAVDPIATLATAGNVIAADTVGAAANFTSTVSSNGGYITGLDAVTAGNTHDIRFRYFVLSQASQVSFTINGLANAAVTGNANAALNGITPSTLNPAFSLYAGILPPSSHDGVGDNPTYAADADVTALLQSEAGFAPWSPFKATNSAIDTAKGLPAGTTAASGVQWGVFKTAGNITTGNDGVSPGGATFSYQYGNGNNSPSVGTIVYTGISGADASSTATYVDSQGISHTVLGADGTVDNTVSWSGLLGPGVYTLAIGGAGLTDYANLYNDVRNSSAGTSADTALNNAYAADRLARKLSITGFSVVSVPEPSTYLLMGMGLVLMGVVGQFRRQVA